MNCPKCGSEMTKRTKTWICKDEDCDHKEPIAHLTLSIADELFYNHAFDNYYPLLAHEYHVLYGFIKNQNYFGALLEYKDIVEIILKFPTLIAINHLWRKNDYDLSDKSYEKAILALLLGKYSGLSLGDWRRICEHFIYLYEKMGKNKDISPDDINLTSQLKPLLEAVNTFYLKEKIVTWRNETIGHGALQSNLDSDAEFIEEFSTRIKNLKTHLEENRDLYERIVTIDASGNELRGKDSEENLSGHLCIRLGDVSYEQAPFILAKDNTTNIFDSCNKTSIYVLNYVTGSKTNSEFILSDVFAEKRRMVLSGEQIEGLDGTILTSDTFVSGMLENLSKMSDEKDAFTVPGYIVNDLKTFLKQDKGILFLQMERGMGKTTLVRALDQLAMEKIDIRDGRKDTAIRAYYINNMFSYRINHFQNQSVVILTNAENYGMKQFVLSNIATDFIKAEDMTAEFARFLNDMLGVYQKQTTYVRKLLYIIDGLDEIRLDESEKRTIFDCIPSPEQLDDGVHIILTGRHNNETSKWIREKYETLKNKSVEIKSYTRDSKDNIGILESYLKKQLPEDKSQIIGTIIEKGDYRFLHVKALRELMRDDAFDINEVGGEGFDKKIMELYLAVLERKYGSGKHFNITKRLLLLISLLNEAATIEELSYLFSFEPANLRFLGYIADLRGLLHIDRTGGIEKIGTMHEEWKRDLVDRNEDMVRESISGWLDDLKHKVKSSKNSDVILDGESYLAANIFPLAESYSPELLSFFFDEDILSFLSGLAEKVAKEKTTGNVERSEKIYTSAISIMEEASIQGKAIDEAHLADCLMRRGNYRAELLILNNAITDYNRCIEILERLLGAGKLFDENNLASAYYESALAMTCMNRGTVYEKIRKYDEALSDKDKSVTIYGRLVDEGRNDVEESLALAIKNRSVTYQLMKRYDESLADCCKCIEILERMKSENKIINENILEQAYVIKNTTDFIVMAEKNNVSLPKEGEVVYRKGIAQRILNHNKKQRNGGKKKWKN